MSCVLRAIGTEFDVDTFLKDSQLGGTVFHRGEPRPTGGHRAASGLNVFKGNAHLHADNYVRITAQGATAGGVWNATTPFTWAAGDRLRGMTIYEAAT